MREGFTTGQVTRLTGVLPATLHNWDKGGFLSPSIQAARGTGSDRLYSFRDLVAVRVAHQFRQAGISLQKLRKLVKRLREMEEIEQPLAELSLVAWDGDVLQVISDDTAVSQLKRPGQGVMAFVLDLPTTVADLRREAEKLAA